MRSEPRKNEENWLDWKGHAWVDMTVNEQGPCGLRNLGNTCYLNSVLQVLACVGDVQHALSQNQKQVDGVEPGKPEVDETPVEGKCSDGQPSPCHEQEQHGGELLRNNSSSSESGRGSSEEKVELSNGSGKVKSARMSSDAPRTLAHTLKEALDTTKGESSAGAVLLLRELCKRAPMFRGGAQQDAHELLRVLLEALMEEETKKLKALGRNAAPSQKATHGPEDQCCSNSAEEEEVCGGPSNQEKDTGSTLPATWVENTFGMTIQSCVMCLQCGGSKNTNEPYLDISLELPEMSSKKKKSSLRKSISRWAKGWRTSNKSGKEVEDGNGISEKEKKRMEKEAKKEEKMKRNGKHKGTGKGRKQRGWFGSGGSGYDSENGDHIEETNSSAQKDADRHEDGIQNGAPETDRNHTDIGAEKSVENGANEPDENVAEQLNVGSNPATNEKLPSTAALLSVCLTNFTRVEKLGADCKVCCDTCTKNSIESKLARLVDDPNKPSQEQDNKQTVGACSATERTKRSHKRALSWADINGNGLIEKVHEVPGSQDNRRTDLWRAACGLDKFFKQFTIPNKDGKGEQPWFSLTALLKGCRLEVCLKPAGNGTLLEKKLLNEKLCHRFSVDIGFIDRQVEDDVLRLSFFAEVIFDCFTSLLLSGGIDHLKQWSAGGLKMIVHDGGSMVESLDYNSSGEESLSSVDSDCVTWQLCGQLPGSEKRWYFPRDFTEVEKYDHEPHETPKNQPKKEPKSVLRDSTRQLKILNPPRVLTLHIKRFQQRGRTFSKYSTYVSFPLELYLDPYCCDPPASKHRKYRLLGVVEHLGKTLQFGHYVAHVRSGNSWYYVSDEYVRQESVEEVLACNAYILLYEMV